MKVVKFECDNKQCRYYNKKKENCGIGTVMLNDLGICACYKHKDKGERNG